MPLVRVIEKLWLFLCFHPKRAVAFDSFAGKEAPAPQKKKRLIDDQVF
jgi:hypothetical protein